jgi:hypothetical protein
MKRWSAALLVFEVCSAVVHADVTIVRRRPSRAPRMAPGGGKSPTITNRIKGMKARMDMDMGARRFHQHFPSCVTAKQVTILDHNQKTARIAMAGQTSPAPSAAAPAGTIKFDSAVTPTGKSQTIDGMKCDEYSFTTSMSMADVGGANMPPEAAAMMKDVTMVMKGSFWVSKDAPGAAEYREYQKTMSSGDLAAAAMGASGLNMPGMDKMMKAMQGVEGMPVLTEMDMTIEGTGQIADMMKQMGAMRITTKVLSVKTDTIGEDVFNVPEGYQIIK